MTDSKDASVNSHQTTAGKAVVDQILAETEVDQLSPRDDAMLPFGKFADHCRRGMARCNVLLAHRANKTLHPG